LAKKYLEEQTGIHLVDTCDKIGRKKHQDISQGIGTSQIAKFLSKEGKVICKSKVAELLKIKEKLAKEDRFITARCFLSIAWL